MTGIIMVILVMMVVWLLASRDISRQAPLRVPPTAHYLSLTGVPTTAQGGVTLYGVREVLEQDNWTVSWLYAQNIARARKAGEGELLLRPGSATVPREQVNTASIQFTREIVLQGERLYAPAAFFQQLMGERFRIDEESGYIQFRQ